MQIAETYTAELDGLKITYKLRDALEDAALSDQIDSILKGDGNNQEKTLKIYQITTGEIVDIKGLFRADSTEVTIEDLKALKVPSIYLSKLIDIYKNHKASLLNIALENAAKN